MMAWMVTAQARASGWAAAIAGAPAEWQAWMDTLAVSLMSGTGVRAITYVLILLLIGGSVEWLYWTYAYSPLRALHAVVVRTARQALRLGVRRLALLAGGVLLFTGASIAASAGLSWPEGVHEAVVGVTLWLMVVRLAWAVVDVVLAPGRSARRLVPVPARQAHWLAALAMAVALLCSAARFLPDLVEEVGLAPHSAGVLRLLLGTLAALLLLVGAFVFMGRPARVSGARLPAFPRSFLVAALVVIAYAAWLLASPAASTIVMVLALVVAAQMVLRAMVFHFWSERWTPAAASAAMAAAAPEPSEPEPSGEAQEALLPHIVLSATRFAVVAVGLLACAVAVDTPISELATRQGPLVRFAFSLLGVAALGLLTHLVWIAVRTSIDRRLRQIGPLDPHGDPNPQARLLTLLPLLRVTSAVALGIMLLLSSLWAIGIEITPLLAGAGVIGLALGFGAQALVRDVIAGIFFLAEDAFRVGEYIESGTSTKGTVERITLRTVALRHHNGPLHFVPYGSLGTVRNNSRDWVIEKFNLPLPIEVDSETVRKLIKKVGEAMLQDEEVGHLLREPLKGKLSRIDPGVKLFRCKFETTPGKQFDVRAQAIKRLEAALKAAGIGFADGRQVVYLQRVDDPVQVVGAAPT